MVFLVFDSFCRVGVSYLYICPKPSLAVCTVSDELRLPEDTVAFSRGDGEIDFHGMSSCEREKSLHTMMVVALETAVRSA